MTKLNPTIVTWLNDGKFLEALSGKSSYFLPDSTYRDEHDVFLVIYVMMKWAFENNKESFCVNHFVTSIKEISKYDIIKGLEIVLAYSIHSNDLKKTLPIHITSLVKYLNDEINGQLTLEKAEFKKAEKLFVEVKKRLLKLDT